MIYSKLFKRQHSFSHKLILPYFTFPLDLTLEIKTVHMMVVATKYKSIPEDQRCTLNNAPSLVAPFLLSSENAKCVQFLVETADINAV